MNYRPPARVTVKAGGRGSGKTYAATRWALNRALENRGTRIAMIGSDNDIESFLEELSEATYRAGVLVDYIEEPRKIVFENGSVIVFYDSLKPERLRGPTYRFVVGEHVEKWPQGTYDYAKFACRDVGRNREQMFLTFVNPESNRILESLGTGFEAISN